MEQKGYTRGKLCACGFPQSYPIPHEHDRTDRENQIIAHYESLNRDLYEALKVAKQVLDSNLYRHPDDPILQSQCAMVDKALAKARS